MSEQSHEDEIRALISRCFGPGCAEYVANKHLGGKSGKKGSRYEDLFVAVKAAEIAADHVDFPEAPWPFLAGQQLGFVDDAILLSDDISEYFQLKNAAAVSWGNGEKSIGDDFSKQFALANLLGYVNPCTHLIVSDKAVYSKLSQTVPDDIRVHSKVSFFPYDDKGTINSLVVGNADVQKVLAKIVADEHATLDTMESALSLILSACNEHPSGCSVEVIVTYVQQRYPAQLRMFPVNEYDEVLTGAFIAALAKITGLCYGISRGYFNWSGYGTSSFFRNHCFSDEFKRFQERIVAAAPATFDDFEKLV